MCVENVVKTLISQQTRLDRRLEFSSQSLFPMAVEKLTEQETNSDKKSARLSRQIKQDQHRHVKELIRYLILAAFFFLAKS